MYPDRESGEPLISQNDQYKMRWSVSLPRSALDIGNMKLGKGEGKKNENERLLVSLSFLSVLPFPCCVSLLL